MSEFRICKGCETETDNFQPSFAGYKRNYCRPCENKRRREREANTLKLTPDPLPSPPPVQVPQSEFARAAFFGDLHFPWHHREKLLRALDLLHPGLDLVAQVGDLMDMFSFSRFPRSHRVVQMNEELSLARQYAEWFWGEVRDRCPRAKLVQLIGNHDDRPLKYALNKAPELEAFVGPGLRDLFTFENVETLESGSDELTVNGASVIHGYLTVAGAHALAGNTPVVHGHDHKLYVLFKRQNLWEMSVGYLGDPKAPCFNYSAWKRAANMQHGIGFLDELGPRVVPL